MNYTGFRRGFLCGSVPDLQQVRCRRVSSMFECGDPALAKLESGDSTTVGKEQD
jgi:hypothetical protein